MCGASRAATTPSPPPPTLVAGSHPAPAGELPSLAGALVGYFAYDLVRRLERLPDAPPDDLGLPEMAFLLADTVLVFDHLKHAITIVANAVRDDGAPAGARIDEPYRQAVARIADVKGRLAAAAARGGRRRLRARRRRRGARRR